MKILTSNFLTCAVKSCKSSPLSYPLHFRDAELETCEMDYNPQFLRNILPRLEWEALRTTAAELGFSTLPALKPEIRVLTTAPAGMISEREEGVEETMDEDPPATVTATVVAKAEDGVGGEAGHGEGEEEKMWRDLHTLLMETQVVEGKLVCGNCGHEYRIKDGIANFLLPNHLV